jgi:succinate-semialdehyde dehydrogenase/glutarate-semialdehyde dehydrogenase
MTASGGERHPDARVLEVRRPSDGSVLGRVPVQGPAEVAEAVARARRIQAEWAAFPTEDRIRRMRALLPALAEAREEIAETIRAETGKPELEAYAEVAVIADLLRHYVATARAVLKPRKVSTGWLLGKRAAVYREPYGVVAVISPWNYPFILVMDPVISALFAGNAAIVKPSEFTPLTALAAQKLFERAHLPNGLVQVVTGDGTTGAALVGADVDKISFTGSTTTGRRVMEAAARRLTPVTMELGGKDPAIVLEDADLERAAAGIAFGAFFNAGQTCISVERVYVVESVYEAFADRISAVTRSLRAGSADGVDVGPMTTAPQLEIVEAQLHDALERGARPVAGGSRADPASNVMLPTVLVDVDPESTLMTNETFGPLLPLMRVRDEEAAIEQANRGAFGLFASVWTRDVERGMAVARRLRAGGVSVNDVLTHYAVPGLPMGGVGQSGFGRNRGDEGLREMSRTRSMLVHRWGRRREVFWFPYGSRKLETVRALVEWRTGGGLGRLLRSFLGRQP